MGIGGGAAALIYLLSHHDPSLSSLAAALLIGACGTLWTARGLMTGMPAAEQGLRLLGIILPALVGLDLLALVGPDVLSTWRTHQTGADPTRSWIWIGLALVVWATLQVYSSALRVVWQGITIPLGLGALVWWGLLWGGASSPRYWVGIVASVVWTFGTLWWLRPRAGEASPTHSVSAAAPSTRARLRPRPPTPPAHYPTKYHEWWAKGHFCQMFGMACTNSCPLPTKVAVRYQQLRLQFQDSPEILDILERAYGLLITPRLRDMCSVAHEIMWEKAKELGPKEFALRESQLWAAAWQRLNESELKTDHRRAPEVKRRILKEL
jgi:hypothetical protein